MRALQSIVYGIPSLLKHLDDNQGEGITWNTSKVCSDMCEHRNPTLRAKSFGRSVTAFQINRNAKADFFNIERS